MEKFLEYGLPERLITDNGPNFRSNLLAEMCKSLRTAHLFSTPYHPQFDGLCERFNRTLTSMLRGFVDEHQRDWDRYLPYLMHAYRAAPQESTREAPFFLMFGRPSRAPLDIQLSTRRLDFPDATGEVTRSKPQFVSRMNKAFVTVQDQLVKAHAKQKQYHDKASKDRRFQVGDEVLLLDERVAPGQTKKLHAPWKPGFRVVEVVGPLNYKLEHPSRRGRILRVHVNRIKHQKPEYVWPEDVAAEDAHQGPMEPVSTGEQVDEWLRRERARFRPYPRDHSPISEESSEEGEETAGNADRGSAVPRNATEPSTPGPVATARAVARPTLGRSQTTSQGHTARPNPAEIPILRRSDRLKQKQGRHGC